MDLPGFRSHGHLIIQGERDGEGFVTAGGKQAADNHGEQGLPGAEWCFFAFSVCVMILVSAERKSPAQLSPEKGPVW
jgi:hypothetical protein